MSKPQSHLVADRPITWPQMPAGVEQPAISDAVRPFFAEGTEQDDAPLLGVRICDLAQVCDASLACVMPCAVSSQLVRNEPVAVPVVPSYVS